MAACRLDKRFERHAIVRYDDPLRHRERVAAEGDVNVFPGRPFAHEAANAVVPPGTGQIPSQLGASWDTPDRCPLPDALNPSLAFP